MSRPATPASSIRKTGHLKIIDRAKDVGRLNDGTLFAPKYIENKLKFYPNIREAVVFGDRRDFVCAMLNIDLTAVGNWAERNNIVYGSYQELAGHPRVYDMLAQHVEEVNRSLAEEKAMAGAPGPALSDPAQGARRRRRRGHAHAEGAPRLRRRALRAADRRALWRRDRGRHLDRGDVRGRPQGRCSPRASKSATWQPRRCPPPWRRPA